MSGPPGLSGEIPGAGVDADGAVAPRVGSDRGARPRPGRHRPGGAGDGYFDRHDRPRAQRTTVASTPAAGTRAAAGWGPEADDRQGPHAAARSGAPRGRSEEHTSELQSQSNLVCRLLLEKKKKKHQTHPPYIKKKKKKKQKT